MPRYLFHFVSRGGVVADQEGVELKDLTAAHQHALRLVCKTLPFFAAAAGPREWVIEVESYDPEARLSVLFPARADRMLP
jgi:hypothetical protein